MRFYRSLRSLQNDSKKARFINRQNILQIFYYAKQSFTLPRNLTNTSSHPRGNSKKSLQTPVSAHANAAALSFWRAMLCPIESHRKTKLIFWKLLLFCYEILSHTASCGSRMTVRGVHLCTDGIFCQFAFCIFYTIGIYGNQPCRFTLFNVQGNSIYF